MSLMKLYKKDKELMVIHTLGAIIVAMLLVVVAGLVSLSEQENKNQVVPVYSSTIVVVKPFVYRK